MNTVKEISENPSLCYQCTKCSSGCPVSDEMDMTPHQLMHCLSLGMEEKAMAANTIWTCAGCYTCSVRCPNDIDITSVMDELRQKAVSMGIKCAKPEVLSFHRTFINSFAGGGRMHEMRLMTENNIRNLNPLHNVKLAPKMILTGRLKILPPKRLKGFKNWIKKLWKK